MLRPFLLLTLTVAHAASLQDKISAATAGFTGTVSIFAKNLDTGATFALRPDERVRTASTIKLPIFVRDVSGGAGRQVEMDRFDDTA